MQNTESILIYFDNYRRDFLVANLLADFLIKEKKKVFITSRNNIIFFSKALNCDVYLFVTNAFNPPSIKIISEIKNKKIVIIDAEGAQTFERCKYFYSHFQNIRNNMDYIYNYASKVFVWNDNVKNFLIENNICQNKNSISVVGSPKMSIMSLMAKKEKNNNTIGFISRFISVNDFLNRSALENIILKHYNNDQYVYSAKGEVESVYVFLNIIDRIISVTDYKISIRPHPNENFSTWLTLVKKFPDRVSLTDPKEDLIEWIQNVDQIISTPSTSLVEPIILGKKIISIHKLLKDDVLDKYYEYSIAGLLEKVHAPNNIEEIMSCLMTDRSFISNNDNSFRENMLDYYNYASNIKYNGILNILDFIKKDKNIITKKIIFLNKFIYFCINLFDLLKFKIRKLYKNYNYLEYNDYIHFISKKNSVLGQLSKGNQKQ